MDTKNIKDEQIRKQIITASEVYRDKLAGRVFLYVYGESYFEVVFPTDRFRHLTGVNSSISAQEFYDKAKSSMLSAGQIFYDREHTYRGAKRKLPCLTMLPALTNNEDFTLECFNDMLLDIDEYERFCETHPGYKNNRAVMAIANIKRVYQDHEENGGFLV